jgi:hypothetical protein
VNNSDNVSIPQAIRYFNLKKDREKSFKVKKLLNELPVMEILKIRNPKTYLPHFLCPRCSKEKETLTHLWECSKADNDILHLQSTTREYIRNLVYKNKDKFINVETLLDQIYKYTKTRKNLKRHSADNARFYKALGGHKAVKLHYTYVWDNTFSLDHLLKGWIPTDLVRTFLNSMKLQSKKFVKKLISRWMGKINNLFFENIWKKRNEDMLVWENQNGITLKDKRKDHKLPSKHRSPNKSTARKERKLKLSSRYEPPDIISDKTWYTRVKQLMGFNIEGLLGFKRIEDTIIIICHLVKVYFYYILLNR